MPAPKTTSTRRRPTRKTAPAKTPSAAAANRVVRHHSFPRVPLEKAEERAQSEGRAFPEVMRAFVKAYGEHRVDV